MTGMVKETHDSLRKPVVVVVGTTSVGKSDFAMDLADALTIKKFHLLNSRMNIGIANLQTTIPLEIDKKYKMAELISADALQIYKGLPIATNQPTQEELDRVIHYCVAEKEVSETYNVKEWIQDVLGSDRQGKPGVLERIREAGKIPIVVGGTSYYIETLLFQNKMVANDTQVEDADTSSIDIGPIHPSLDKYPSVVRETAYQVLWNTRGQMTHEAIKTWVEKELLPPTVQSAFGNIELVKTNILHELVQLIDPVMGKRWHPNDIRKCRRVVEVWYNTGQRLSQVHEQQKQDNDGIRVPTVLVWVVGDWEVVRDRMQQRIGKMQERGLISELEMLAEQIISGTDIVGYEDGTMGVSQAIGVKEFKPYLDLYIRCRKNMRHSNYVHPLDSLDVSELDKKKLIKLRTEGLELMNIRTRQYAKRQITWLRNKLVHECWKLENPFVDVNSDLVCTKGDEKPKVLVYLVDATEGRVKQDTVNEIADIVMQFEKMYENVKDQPNKITFPTATKFIPPTLFQYLEPNKNTELWTQYVCDVCSEEGKKKVLNGEKEYNTHMQSVSHRKRVRYLARQATRLNESQ